MSASSVTSVLLALALVCVSVACSALVLAGSATRLVRHVILRDHMDLALRSAVYVACAVLEQMSSGDAPVQDIVNPVDVLSLNGVKATVELRPLPDTRQDSPVTLVAFWVRGPHSLMAAGTFEVCEGRVSIREIRSFGQQTSKARPGEP